MQTDKRQDKFKDTFEKILVDSKIGEKVTPLEGNPVYRGPYCLSCNVNSDVENRRTNTTFFKDIMDALLKDPANSRNCLNKDSHIDLGGGYEHILRYNPNTGNLTLLMNGRVANNMIIEKKTNLHFLVSNPYLARKYGSEKMDKYTFYLEQYQIDINNWPTNVIPSISQTEAAMVLHDVTTKETLILNEKNIDTNEVLSSNFLNSVKMSLKRGKLFDKYTVLKTISDLCNRRKFFKSSFQNTISNIPQWHYYPNYPMYYGYKPIISNKDIDITVDFNNRNPRFVL